MIRTFLSLLPLTHSLSIEPFHFADDPFDFSDISDVNTRNRRQLTEGSGTDATDTQTESFSLIIPQYTCTNGVPPELALVQSQLSDYIDSKGLVGTAVVQSVRCGSLIVDWYIEQNGLPTFVDLPGFTMNNIEEIIELFTQGEVPADTPGLRTSITLDSSAENMLAPSMEDTTVVSTTTEMPDATEETNTSDDSDLGGNARPVITTTEMPDDVTDENTTVDDSDLGGNSGPVVTTTSTTTVSTTTRRPNIPVKVFPAPQVKENFTIKIPNYTCIPAGVPPPKSEVTERLAEYFKDKNVNGQVEVKDLSCSSLEIEYEVTQPDPSALVDLNDFTYVNLEEIIVAVTGNENFDTSDIRTQVSLASGSAGSILSPDTTDTTTKSPRPPVLGSSSGSLATSLLLVFVFTGML